MHVMQLSWLVLAAASTAAATAAPIGDASRQSPPRLIELQPFSYPSIALGEGRGGIVRYSLTVTARGKIAQCAVIASSGHEDLDKATCKNLRSKARFAPARDDQGRAVTGTYVGNFKWVVPGTPAN